MTLLTLQTQRGEVMWFAIFCGDSEAGGTAGGCELMLLTLGNGEQTWRQEGCMVGGRGESKKKKKKELVRKRMEAAVPLWRS